MAVRVRAVPWEPPPVDRPWTADRKGAVPLAPRSVPAQAGRAGSRSSTHSAGRKPGLQPARQ